MSKRLSILLLVATLLFSCAPKVLREAKEVVAQADSLRAAGQMYTDSARLAESYSILHAWRYVCGDEYAHACYHYGRLLREKENPVEAMQCFINASHARTRDYHILGRVYSNMGDIAHLAGEFPLAYDMYERSGQMYLQNGDSLLYYYDLNNMAFELAEQGKKEETLMVLASIDERCVNPDVIAKTWETKAEMYLKCGQYDSVICYANLMTANRKITTTGLLIKAEAFSYLALKDSALYYARQALSQTHSHNEQFNALYILSHDDISISENELLELTSLRDDIHTYELDAQKTKHAKAIQIWQNAENEARHVRMRYITWTLLILFITIVCICVIYYVNRKHRLLKREKVLLAEQKEEMTQIVKANTDSLQKQLMQFEQTCSALRTPKVIQEKISWNDYQAMCTIVDNNFAFIASKLESIYHLSEKEVRLCILVLIDGFSSKQMAEMLFYAESGIRNLKSNTAKKIGTNGKEMRQFLVKMAYG